MNAPPRLDTDRFTPGEWTTERDGSLVIGGQVCTSGVGPDTADRAELRANNRLISAAPNLLAAARAAAEAIADEAQAYSDHGMDEQAAPWLALLNTLEAAIAKAV